MGLFNYKYVYLMFQRHIPPPAPSVVMNGRKPRNKGEGRGADGGNDDNLQLYPAPPKRAKPVQLLIVEKEDVEDLENGKPLYFRERERGPSAFSEPVKSNGEAKGKQTSTVSHPILGDVHVSVRPANPALGRPSNHLYDVESTEDQIKNAKGPVPPDIPLHLLENLDERSSTEGATGSAAPSESSPRENVIIPTKYATAFSPVKSSANTSRSNPDGGNTYIGYQEGLDLNVFPVRQIVTAKPPAIPGRHNSQITAHVIPIPFSQYKNYPIGVLPPPPAPGAKVTQVTSLSHSMAIKEQLVKMQLVPNGDSIRINMPENYIQRIPPEHDHDGRRFSQPVVVYLNPDQNMGLSQLSVYDNVQYVWAEPPSHTANPKPK